MMRLIFIFIAMSIFSGWVEAQGRETIDLATFNPPAGWKKESKEGVALYTNTNQQNGYCLIGVYRSKASLGDLKSDFNSEWKEVVAGPFKVTAAPQTEAAQENEGWKILLGTANFQDAAGGTSAVMLTVVSGYNRRLSILVILNDQSYMPTVEKFLDAVKFTKPAAGDSDTPQPRPTTAASGSSGISIATTNFDDGWVATVQGEYVLAQKGNINVSLFYGIKFTDEIRAQDTADYFWRTVVVPRYTIQSAVKLEPPIPDALERLYYIEGQGTERQSGKACFIAMRVVAVSGIAKVIVGTAPNKQAYYSQIPNPDALRQMLTRNYFAVTPQDLTGYWKGGSAGAEQLYNIYTGANEGVNMVSTSDEFTFNNNGTYQARLVGASGQVGAIRTYDQRLNGSFNTTNWETTLTNFSGKTVVFLAYFEAVKGGRILHFTQKNATGMQYHLFKVK
jgi:hypothetical protein